MNDDTLVYGLTEEQQSQLYQAKHLSQLLADLSGNLANQQQFVTLDAESLAVAFRLLHDRLNIDYKSL